MKTKPSTTKSQLPARIKKSLAEDAQYLVSLRDASLDAKKNKHIEDELNLLGLSLDQFANIAAMFVESRGLFLAAETAYLLLEVCRHTIRWKAVERVENEASNCAGAFGFPDVVTYILLSKAATGQTRKDRAEQDFFKYLKDVIREGDVRASCISDLKAGVSREAAEWIVSNYRAWELEKKIEGLGKKGLVSQYKAELTKKMQASAKPGKVADKSKKPKARTVKSAG